MSGVDLPFGMSWRKCSYLEVQPLEISFSLFGSAALCRQGQVWFSSKVRVKTLLQISVGLWQGLICDIIEGAASWSGNVGTKMPLEIKQCNEIIPLKADFQVCCKPS